MYSLNNHDFRSETADISSQIFLNNDLSYPYFTEKIKNRCVLFPCYTELNQGQYINNRKLLSAIADSATNINDSGCYISYLYHDGEYANTNAFVPISNLKSAFGYEVDERMCIKLDMGIGWEYMVFSSHANWGTIVYQYKYYALLGGNDDFMKSFYHLFPEARDQVYLFLEFCEKSRKNKNDQLKLDWLPPLLVHVYGYELAKNLLIKTNLIRFSEVSDTLRNEYTG